jgi:CHAT domain-containing protein
LGELEVELGDWWKGYNHLVKSLNGFKSEENPPHERIALIYNTIAAVLYQTNQKDLRMLLYQKATDLFLIDTNDRRSIGAVFRLSGEYFYAGEVEKSLTYLNIADSLITYFDMEDENFFIHISLLSARMSTYLKLGKTELARKDHLAFEKRIREKVGIHHMLYSFAYESEAILFQLDEQYDSVINCYKKAMALRPGLPILYSKMAETYHLKGDFKKAIQYYRENIYLATDNDSIYRENDNIFLFKDLVFDKTYEYRNDFGIDQLTGVFAIPQVYIDFYEETKDIEYLEKGWAYSALCDSVLTFFQSSAVEFDHADIYPRFYHQVTGVTLQLLKYRYQEDPQQKYLDKMLYYMSQSTAFMLNAEVNNMGYATQESELKFDQIQVLSEIRSLKNELNAVQQTANTNLYELLTDSLIDKSLRAFEISYQLNSDTNRLKLEKYGAIYHCSEIQDNLQNNEALWVSNILEDVLVGMLVTKDTVYYHTYDSVTDDIENYYRSLKTGRNDWKETGAVLYKNIFSQWNDQLEDIDHLVIIPDGDLGQIAFEAFYDNESEELLIEKAAISYHYSAWLWNQEEQNKKDFSEMSWCGFAPVFSNEASHIDAYAYTENDLEIYRDNGALKALEYSEKEIYEIASIIGNEHRHTASFLYDKANEEEFKSSAPEYDIIHIATHGKVSKRDQTLSGLYFFEGESEDITNDGFLYLGEMFSIPMNANLVVLSACKSGAGKIQEGDAAQAFPRAFINNGVDNLVVSLWKIHDERSKDLMVDFYKNLTTGMTYPKALQQAKLAQIKKGLSPKDWGAMILIGK